MFGQADLGTVSQVVYDCDRFLQGFADTLSLPQLSVERFMQAVVTVAVLERRTNFFLRAPPPPPKGRHVECVRPIIQGGDQVCGPVAERTVIVFHHGLGTAVGRRPMRPNRRI
jgi:hypothetical protein